MIGVLMTASPFWRFSNYPQTTDLYDPAEEKDSCGVAMVATLRGYGGNDIVQTALGSLCNLEHRGAVGSDAGTGDGAGILLQIPHKFFSEVVDFELPEFGHYGAGLVFEDTDANTRDQERRKFEDVLRQEGLELLGWREIETNNSVLGDLAREAMPHIGQVFVKATNGESELELERMLFRARKRSERELGLYHPTLSCRTIVYKGMLTTLQLQPFFKDLQDTRVESKMALVHSRFSTNTFPSWPLAHPFRLIAHNGEINTVKGNTNWMRAREATLASDLIGDLEPLRPIVTPGASDSASFDEVLELLHLSGRSLPHSIMMMIPEAWEKQKDMDPKLKAFYEYHSLLMEPWDGPASVTFTDGSLVGATLDRNGLRPGRFLVTDDGLVILGSETGVYDVDPAKVIERGRLQPGKMFLVDTDEGRIISDAEIKQTMAEMEDWGSWLESNRLNLRDLPERDHVRHSSASVERRQRMFGYTEEELKEIIGPMAMKGIEPIGAMGTDTPIAAISDRPRLLFDYFTQQFAQVTNPPLDAIREEIVTSLSSVIGPEGNILTSGPGHAKRMIVDFPVLDNDEMAKIKHIKQPSTGFTHIVDARYGVDGGEASLAARLEELAQEVDQAIENGASFLVISDRDSNRELAPIPSLLATSAIHHHLIRKGTRTKVGVVVEAGDVREVHHVAVLVGFGAAAVNPYLALETAEELVRTKHLVNLTTKTATANIAKSLGKGVLKVMSKMGISTVSSYSGAQCFEAVGLSQELVDRYFTGTTSKLGGVGLDILHQEIEHRHRKAYPIEEFELEGLDVGGELKWRREGPPHLFNPETVFKLQHSTRAGRYDIFKQYTNAVDDQSERLMTLRGLFKFRTEKTSPIPIDEVEPVSEIVKRFATGAMSYGSISPEAHETLAIAMNRLGAKSNTGEGGERLDRLTNPETRSSIKQVASGRFGVTSMYLTHADDIQIKMAQGAKPGEGGQLPPGKVYPFIAEIRHSTPGVGLISPPPHHDIYSIEDLKQLIFDLKRANPSARIHVKLVSQFGVGTVAAGVAKAKSDVVLISGHDGGTGASPLNSLKHAGTPWEIGLAETQQTLMHNGLRDRVSVQVDGQMKTGRDVMVAALLGAEEYGFSTAPLVVSGCVLMRVCHLDTCPVGVATGNPVLRERFSGKAEFVVNFFEYLAQEVREYLAELGFRSLDEAIGRVDLLDVNRAIKHWKADGLDLRPILSTELPEGERRNTTSQDHELEKHFDQQLIKLAETSLEDGLPVEIDLPVSNVNQAVGTMLGHELTKRFGHEGLPEGTIDIRLRGSAGQSLGAFVPKGIAISVEGDVNDYLGKGLSGGKLAVRPYATSSYKSHESVIAGNVIGYGATSGKIFVSGIVGERFLVRNSGVVAVVEGVGDHALEYMTGGEAVILGTTGINVGAGMSGGIGYFYELNVARVNEQAMESGELIVEGLNEFDQQRLRKLLEEHVELTGSEIAKGILDNFDEQVAKFSKLLPSDYARVLEIRTEAIETGADPDGEDTWTKILEVTNG
jgi:glutamate synthase (NADPH/NADH) large chain